MSQPVVRRTVVVTDPAGVHIRTASLMAKIARGSHSEVTVIKGDQRMSAADIIGVFGMETHQGETLVLEAAGPDATDVLDALEPLFAGEFGDTAPKNA
jgi:phosphotransferase system HPr (HPr) family protein